MRACAHMSMWTCEDMSVARLHIFTNVLAFPSVFFLLPARNVMVGMWTCQDMSWTMSRHVNMSRVNMSSHVKSEHVNSEHVKRTCQDMSVASGAPLQELASINIWIREYEYVWIRENHMNMWRKEKKKVSGAPLQELISMNIWIRGSVLAAACVISTDRA